MVFTSTHLSLRSSLSSTQGLNPFKPLLNQLGLFLLRVYLSNFRHQSSVYLTIFSRLRVYLLELTQLLNNRLSFDKQVSETCKASYFHIRALRHIRSSLTTEAAKTVASAIVGSRLDYCNSLLAGTSVSNLARLQLVQNTLACVVAQKSRFDHITPVLSELSLASRSSQNKFQDSYHHSQGAAVSTTLLPRCTHSTVCTCAITPIFFILVNMCSFAPKPPWQPLDHFHPSHQQFGMHCQVIFSSIPTLPAFRRGLKHQYFLACLSWQ